MSAPSNVIQLPTRESADSGGSLDYDLVLGLATAEDLRSGMGEVAERIRRSAGAVGAEWWAAGDDGGLEVVAAAGAARGVQSELPLGSAGAFVLHGGRVDAQVEAALTALAPIVRRRAAEEQLARTAVELARRNEALEDFAALVAHELKTPLQAALVADDPSGSVEDALDLVDGLLEAARNDPGERTFSSVAECVGLAADDLGAHLDVSCDLRTTLPLPPGPLRVILRNLLANAVAAGARRVHVVSVRSSRSWRLLVDDDGVGLGEDDLYVSGSGLGLSLSRRIAARFGGALELSSRPCGGTRATLALTEVA
jgi:signal transduction histidine kinase